MIDHLPVLKLNQSAPDIRPESTRHLQQDALSALCGISTPLFSSPLEQASPPSPGPSLADELHTIAGLLQNLRGQ
jgi:hypothetical protein